MDEQKLIDKIRKGDQSKFEELYKNYREGFITWMITKYSVSIDDAKEIYQRSIIVFYENIVENKLEKMSSKIKTYLFGIGKNLIHQHKRNQFRYKGFSDILEQDFDEGYFGDNADMDVLIEVVKTSLEKLGDPCKSLLELHYYHKMSMEEITEKLQYKNSTTTKNLKYKCLLRLRKIFNKENTKNKTIIYG